MLTVIDEFARRCLAIVVARKLNSHDVLDCLTHLFVAHGTPENVRSDNGPEFVARNVRAWLGRIGVKTLFRSWSRPALMDGLGLGRVCLGDHVSFGIRWAKDSPAPSGGVRGCRSLR
jgi:Integrase core domain